MSMALEWCETRLATPGGKDPFTPSKENISGQVGTKQYLIAAGSE
jgi:hypothetical protein